MANVTNEENWAARERLRRVEYLLWWRGWVGRGDLTGLFGISPAQASSDLQRYADLNPSAMVYQTRRKRYESGESMVCVLHAPSFEEAVREFFGGGVLGARLPHPAAAAEEEAGPLAVVRLPERRVDVALARRVLIALQEKRRIQVRYFSVSSGSGARRELFPHGLAWDGWRWHLRAWCFSRSAWRDFVVGRISEADWPGTPPPEDLPADEDWETFETVRLRLNPKLPPNRRKGLRMDYGLAGDTLEMRVRRSMRPYLMAAMRLDEEAGKELPRHFVCSSLP